MSSNQFVTGLIVAAAVGAVAGLLIAPKPGKVTRRFVGMRANKMRLKASDYLEGLRRRREVQESVNGHAVIVE